MSWIQKVGKYSNYVARNYNSRINNIDRHLLEKEVKGYIANPPIIKSVINGNEIDGYKCIKGYSPCNGMKHIFSYQPLSNKIVVKRDTSWENKDPEEKFQVFEKIADLIENKYYYKMMAATMIGQGKNTYEAEIDSIGELVDFLRFNIQYASEIYKKQPISPEKNVMNYSQYLPLHGNTLAITPFNFTAIAGNLATAPLLFGNNVIWKPSEKSLLSNWLFYQICMEGGIPEHNLHFLITDDPSSFTYNYVDKNTSIILFTGSTTAFQSIMKHVDYSENYPRLVGETGGKNFHFVEKSANLNIAVEKTFHSAFNYSGQKCSACSILYLPEMMYGPFMKRINDYKKIFNSENYGVISRDSFYASVNVIETCKGDFSGVKLVMGGNYKVGNSFYIEPTIFKKTQTTAISILEEKELFAPILLVKTYNPDKIDDAIQDCIESNNYKLTGAIFCEDQEQINYLTDKFKMKTGNFYINDKSTGAVVGQQPFGGFGLSGTNDKAGDINMLYRLFNQRTIKHTTL